MKKIEKSVIIIFISLIFLLFVFIPYIQAEILTIKYGNEFNDLQKQTNILTEAHYYKVLSYSDEQAKVFYVSDTGDVIIFKKNAEGNWDYSEWKTIWSNSGSAGEFYWPYYR